MIEISGLAFIKFLIMFVVSICAGLSVARFLPWSEQAQRVKMPLVFGFSLGPLLLGLSVVCAFQILPGGAHQSHLIIVNILLILIALFGLRGPSFSCLLPRENYQKLTRTEWVFVALLSIWILGIFLNICLVPLFQNDPLEYVTVGKILFESRDLASYPAIHPDKASSGFYAPWSHPPLYVCLIYLMDILQGNGDVPSLMRLIGPWCTLSATCLVYAMGKMAHRHIGLLSAVIFLFCPLMYMSTNQACIDPLPVLGMTLILSSLFSLTKNNWKNGIVYGGLLGLSLWTHSETVLFIPLTMAAIISLNGLKNIKLSTAQIVIMMGVALLIAFWPYYKNYTLLGVIISDDTTVFKLKHLKWEEYFEDTRGISSLTAKIIYGLFKGWFTLESFSFIYWVMTVGIVVYIVKIIKSKRGIGIFLDNGSDPKEYSLDNKYLSLLTIFICYMLGVVASLLIKMNIMIQNERYLLILGPIVALFAGKGIYYTLFSKDTFNFLRKRNGLITTFFMVIFVMQWGILQFIVFNFFLKDHGWRELAAPFEEKLQSLASYQAVSHIKKHIPQGATVLSMRPADMYYSHRRMVSYIDPILLDVYQESEPLKALEMLHKIGIKYILVPDYGIPCIYNSSLNTLLGDPNLSHILFYAHGYLVYKLADDISAPSQERKFLTLYKDLTPDHMPWILGQKIGLTGRQDYPCLYYFKDKFVFSTNPTYSNILNFYKINLATIIPSFGNYYTGSIRDEDFEKIPNISQMLEMAKVEGNQEYLLEAECTGLSLVSVYFYEYDNRGRLVNSSRITQAPLRMGRVIKQRFLTTKETCYMNVVFNLQYSSNFKMTRVNIFKVNEEQSKP